MRALYILPFFFIVLVLLFGLIWNLPTYFGPSDRDLLLFAVIGGFFFLGVVALWKG